MKFSTTRLLLREYTLDDAPFIYELMNSEGWLKYIGDRSIQSVADAKYYIEKNYLNSYLVNGFGAYIVQLRDCGTPIGSSGLYKRDDLDYPDIGFAFLPEYCNQGYAFEAARATMEYARNEFQIDTILGITVPENYNSIKLLKKIGLHPKDRISLKNDDVELLLFSTES